MDAAASLKVPTRTERTSSFARMSKPTPAGDNTTYRWAWQSIPVLQLPPVPAAAPTIGELTKRPPLTLLASVESRITRVKEEGGKEEAMKKAEGILRERRREDIGRWVNDERDFVKENRCRTGGSNCCRRRLQQELDESKSRLREQRRETAVGARDARQRLLIASTAMASSECYRRKATRDCAFAELVHRRIFIRNGGNVRSWLIVVATIKRLQFLQGSVERAARRQMMEVNMGRVTVVTRFLTRIILKRRRERAGKIIEGALGAFTNSNAVRRYASRVKGGYTRLQALARNCSACVTAHITLLNRHWDRLYPPSLPTASPLTPAPDKTAVLPTQTIPSASPESAPNGKRSARRRGGGKQKGKNRSAINSKRQGEPIAAEERVVTVDEDKEAHPVPATAEGTTTAASERLRPQVSSESKAEEILMWLRRVRAKHCKDAINYERFTVFPCMVELLLQHEADTYRSRLQAVKHVTFLRRCGRLSQTWVREGYFARMAHAVPAPPGMQRLFSKEEGDEMFERAVARSTVASPCTPSQNTLHGPTTSSVAKDGEFEGIVEPPEKLSVAVGPGTGAVTAAGGSTDEDEGGR